MLFNSLTFVVFIALFFLLYAYFKNSPKNLRLGFLVVCSFFFYGWWDWRYIFLLIISGLIDFYAAQLMQAFPKSRKLMLILSMTSNLLLLFSFKYVHFLTGIIESVFHSYTVANPIHIPEFLGVLPVGISFYTFQSMSYTIDVYQRKITPTNNLLHFFAFLSLFPQLVAGPIVRASELLPQLNKTRQVTQPEQWHGFKLIALGYFKKTVLADNIAPFVNSAFSNDLDNPSTFFWWTVMIGFAFQIYLDFSGYSDIARGLAKLMGIHFRLNFNAPYLSASFQEFWRRWHISLSTWFRDYLYKPLGGSRRSELRNYFNLWITMLVSGLWHGAGFNFILWGALHAFYLTVEKLTAWPKYFAAHNISKVVGILLTFTLTTVAWVFFRASNFNAAKTVLRHMFQFHSTTSWGVKEVQFAGLFFLCLSVMIEIMKGLRVLDYSHLRMSAPVKAYDVAYVSVLVIASVFLRGTGAQFIYFQF